MSKARPLQRLGQRTWFGTIHAYIDAARRELNHEGRRILYRDLRALITRYEAEEARHEREQQTGRAQEGG
jgi:hypothetical protein